MTDQRRAIAELREQVEEFLKLFGKEDREQERRDQAIIDHFKYGVRKVCAVEIWQFVKKVVGARTQEELAARFDISASVVSRGLKDGALSLENLIVILTDVGLEFRALPDMPHRERRAIGGYEEATWYARVKVLGQKVDGRCSLANYV